jgi:serine/threonine protein kinase
VSVGVAPLSFQSLSTDPQRSVSEGDLLAGRYRIGALLGEGGYGRVLQATQLPLDREVAIKIVTASDPEVAARFMREAAIIQKLEHPNTVRVLDLGTTPSGDPFLVLELLRGKDLDGVLEQRGRLSPEEALGIVAQVLKSLAEAHEKGIVHRDIKPGNVFITSHFGEPLFVKVLDFGIAKQLGGDKLTMAGEMLGTPSYMSPEQAMGRPIDARTDLYALGLMLAEMVTGRVVYDKGGPLTIVDLQTIDAPVPLGKDVLSSPVGAIVERATQKDASLRYRTAAEMLVDVEATRLALTRAPAPPEPRALPPQPQPQLYAPPPAPHGSAVTAFHQSAPFYPPVPATVLQPTLRRAPAPAASRNRVAILAIGLAAAALLTVLVVLLMGAGDSRKRSGETDESDDEPSPKRTSRSAPTIAPVTASPVIVPSPSARPRKTPATRTRARTPGEMKRVLTDAGYRITATQEGTEDTDVYTFQVEKNNKCFGSIMRLVALNESIKEQQRTAFGKPPHCRVETSGLVLAVSCFAGADGVSCLAAAPLVFGP